MTSNTGEKLNISKQIIMTGDNLLDAQPRVDNQSSEPIVSFNLDRFVHKNLAMLLQKMLVRD